MDQSTLYKCVLYGSVHYILVCIVWISLLYTSVCCMDQSTIYECVLSGLIHSILMCIVRISLLYTSVCCMDQLIKFVLWVFVPEVRLTLLFWVVLILTWLWGGLHMVYGQLWMLILFCIFDILQVSMGHRLLKTNSTVERSKYHLKLYL